MREFELLRQIYRANADLPARVTIPPGDDMGGLRIGGAEVLVTVDQLADGIHFDLLTTPLAKAGRKAITRNLSDVAAMAAVPCGAVVAACLPRGFGEDRAMELFDAMRTTGDAYGCPIFGGDLAFWEHPLLLSVTVLAEAAGVPPLHRRGAQVGDAVFVSGSLGGSPERVGGRIHHLDFEPRLSLARRLAEPAARPRCMIDLSDGLGRDLAHLCEGTGVAARLVATHIPAGAGAHQAAVRDGIPAWRHALADGEDYELCFTLPADRANRLPPTIEGVPLTRVGEIIPADASHPDGSVWVEQPDGALVSAAELGWEHTGT